MATPTLTIVIPTIKGREERLERAECLFHEMTTVPHETITLLDYPSCGLAWQEGGERAKGDYVYMAADDAEPKSVGWELPAIAACDRGVLPAGRVYYPDGRIQSCGEHWEMLDADGEETRFTRVPFMSRAQWEIAQPMLPCHYFTDDWVSWKCAQAGIPSVITYGFDIVHHLAPEGRDEGRMQPDLEMFMRATQGEDVWQESS